MNEGASARINWPLPPALLRLDPMFDPPRNDPYGVYPSLVAVVTVAGFQKLITSSAAK